MHVLSRYHYFLLEPIFHRCGNGFQHTACSRNADFRQRHVDLAFQCQLDLINGPPNPANIVNLPVQHGTCFMLPHILGNHIKVILVLVSHRAYHVPCADVKAEYQRYPFQLLLHFIQFPFLLDCLGNLIKRFFPCAIIFNHHLAVFPVFAVRKLAPEHAFHLFLGIAPGAHQAFFPDFLRGADIP